MISYPCKVFQGVSKEKSAASICDPSPSDCFDSVGRFEDVEGLQVRVLRKRKQASLLRLFLLYFLRDA